ncbi:MAG: cupin domain-containing protein [Pseudomonadota bacterium]
MIDDIGARLKQLRERFSLSQRELAKRAGVTNSLVSLIETNKTSPTIASLRKVLDGFPITMTEFFTPEDPSAKQQTFYLKGELPDVGTQGIAYLLVGAKRRKRALCMLHEHYEPGADTGEEMISHPGEEAGVIVSGFIEITVGDETRVLGEGDAYYFETSSPHRMRNPGNEKCVVVSASTPPTY